jgi:EAL domain-containing protein (putative c-di-GMP-specific phosphodiesterase class I)
MFDTERASEAIRRVTALGVVFAVDDFGTGYSSLSHLRHLKIQHLKIDRSFVSDLEHDRDDAAIVRAVIQLAQNLRLRTIAEGVETAAQKEFLRTHGCDLVQGYLIAKPMPLIQLLEFLRSWR